MTQIDSSNTAHPHRLCGPASAEVKDMIVLCLLRIPTHIAYGLEQFRRTVPKIQTD